MCTVAHGSEVIEAPTVLYASTLCTVIEDDLERGEAVHVFVRSEVSRFCILKFVMCLM